MIPIKEMALAEMGKDITADDAAFINWSPTFPEPVYSKLVAEDNKNLGKEWETNFTHELFIILIADAKSDLAKSKYSKEQVRSRYDKFFNILEKSEKASDDDKEMYLNLYKGE